MISSKRSIDPRGGTHGKSTIEATWSILGKGKEIEELRWRGVRTGNRCTSDKMINSNKTGKTIGKKRKLRNERGTKKVR